MAATHKHSGATVFIRTELPSERAAQIAHQVAEDTARTSFLAGASKIRFTGAGEGRVNFAVRNMGTLSDAMTFSVFIVQDDKGTEVRSRIISFKTTQSRYLLIPMGPKTLLGYRGYKAYMENLRGALAEADPASHSTITERVA